jgi:hypothetical protein
MNFPKDDDELHNALAQAFTPPPTDFDAWQRQHAQAVAFLNPQRMIALARRRRMMSRAAVFVVAATVLICVWLGLTHFATDDRGSSAFAQTAEQIQKAKTITWNITFYERFTSKDGKRTWLESRTVQCAYKSPGLYREVWPDTKREPGRIDIFDVRQREAKKLKLYPTQKKAVLSQSGSESRNPLGPFEWAKKRLNADSLQWVETRTTARGPVNVFRYSFPNDANGRQWSYDFWIDQKSKQLVESRRPGGDLFDPDKEADRNHPPENKWSGRTSPGLREHDIVLDAALDDSLFSLSPPEGYALKKVNPRPTVTEKEMLDYLGVLADFNDRTFPDQVFPVFPNAIASDKMQKVWKKPKQERTVAEQKLFDAQHHYIEAGVTLMPIACFVEDHAVEKSFRYLGKGVRLGDKDRIVCWYKLKDAKDPNVYRVVYGDLSVKDVAAEDLPLPVAP